MDALGKLTGGIAHDFNNMLGVILGYSELILLKSKNDSSMGKYVEQIKHAGDRGKKLTQKLLAFSRRKDVKSELVDLNVLLNDNHHMLTKSLTSKIELKYVLSDGLWTARFDKGDMEDVLINLCINAMHAMPDGGVLTIHTENVFLSEEQAKLHNLKAGNYIHLSITDTGIDGIEVISELGNRDSKAALILMSGFDQELLQTSKRMAEAHGLNVIETLTKPMSISDISELLENLKKTL